MPCLPHVVILSGLDIARCWTAAKIPWEPPLPHMFLSACSRVHSRLPLCSLLCPFIRAVRLSKCYNAHRRALLSVLDVSGASRAVSPITFPSPTPLFARASLLNPFAAAICRPLRIFQAHAARRSWQVANRTTRPCIPAAPRSNPSFTREDHSAAAAATML